MRGVLLACMCLIPALLLPLSSTPQRALAAKSIDIIITPSVFYYSEGNDVDFEILIENHSNESLSFSVNGTLHPDMQATTFAGENVQNRTNLVLNNTVTNVTQNFDLHWQGNWVFEVEVIGYNQTEYKAISNSSRYWLYIHSSTEEFQKSQVEVTRILAIVAAISAAIAAISAGFGASVARSSRQEQEARLRPLLAITSAQNFYHSTKDKMRLQVVVTNMGSVPAANVRVSYWETKHEDPTEIIQERSRLSLSTEAVGTIVQGTDSVLEHIFDWPKSQASNTAALWIQYSYLGTVTGQSAAVLYLKGNDGPVRFKFFADDELR